MRAVDKCPCGMLQRAGEHRRPACGLEDELTNDSIMAPKKNAPFLLDLLSTPFVIVSSLFFFWFSFFRRRRRCPLHDDFSSLRAAQDNHHAAAWQGRKDRSGTGREGEDDVARKQVGDGNLASENAPASSSACMHVSASVSGALSSRFSREIPVGAREYSMLLQGLQYVQGRYFFFLKNYIR